jgi:uncharacterized protein (TIGR02001 family)
MKKTLLSLSIAAAAVSVPTQAADIGGGLDLSANVAMASDYIWRGMTQTDGEPAISGGFDLAHDSGLYIGTWASNVDSVMTGGSELELDYYFGYATELGPVGVDVGYISFNYPGSNPSFDFEEIYTGASVSAGPVDLGATYYFGQDAAPDAWELSAGSELAGIGLSATYGDYDAYGSYYSIGASKELVGLEFSVTYSEMDYDAASSTDEDAVVFAVAKSF